MNPTKDELEVIFSGCSDAQAMWCGGEDPRKLLKKGQAYKVVRTEVFDFYTHYYIKIDGKEIPFNSGCFGEWKEQKIELPKKLTTIIADSEHAFVIRIGTEPRTTDTGIANIIPINRDISRQGRDRTIQIAEHFVNCWNSHDDLLEACKRDAELADAAILLTPTGEHRNRLTDVNILRLRAIAKAGQGDRG